MPHFPCFLSRLDYISYMYGVVLFFPYCCRRTKSKPSWMRWIRDDRALYPFSSILSVYWKSCYLCIVLSGWGWKHRAGCYGWVFETHKCDSIYLVSHFSFLMPCKGSTEGKKSIQIGILLHYYYNTKKATSAILKCPMITVVLPLLGRRG